MRNMLKPPPLSISLGVLFVWVRATAIPNGPQLPADVPMNEEAGRGGKLFVTLRLDDGEELPFLLDTGASGTVLDKSLEPKLGKQLGTEPSNSWGGKGKANTYAAPKLYIGDTPLLTGNKVWTTDLNHPSGILGMDCLKHYCVQLDFQSGKMRFLNSAGLNTNELGARYPLILKGGLPYIRESGLVGCPNTELMIDVGCSVDGLTEKTLASGLARFLPECVWEGTTYSDIAVAAVDHANVIGIRFLARHLVTLDFPGRMMYLKHVNSQPLAGDSSTREFEAPVQFLEALKEKGQLPGLSKNVEPAVYLEAYSNFDSQPEDSQSVAYIKAYFSSTHKSATFALQDDASVCHYTISRVSKDNSWKLEKAWRTKLNGKTIEEFPVP